LYSGGGALFAVLSTEMIKTLLLPPAVFDDLSDRPFGRLRCRLLRAVAVGFDCWADGKRLEACWRIFSFLLHAQRRKTNNNTPTTTANTVMSIEFIARFVPWKERVNIYCNKFRINFVCSHGISNIIQKLVVSAENWQ
jgi:hypothetical protein